MIDMRLGARRPESLIAVLLFLVAACSPAMAPAPGTSSVRVSGLWVGRLDAGGVSAPVEMSLLQRGDQVGGTAETTFRGSPLRGTVEARLSGTALQGSILGPSRTASFTLNLEGEALKGTIGGIPLELRRRGYLAESVFRSSERGALDPSQAP